MTNETEIKIPDIGGATNVDVIEILVKEGDKVELDTPLLTLETEKASMEIPSPFAGIIKKVLVAVGAKVSEGDIVCKMDVEGLTAKTTEDKSTNSSALPSIQESTSLPIETKTTPVPPIPVQPPSDKGSSESCYAGPAVRRMAREFGVDLACVVGTGRKSRISKEDLQQYVKTRLQEKQSPSGFALPSAPTIDFTKFGEIEKKPLNKIKKLTGVNVHRSWITIPHVTQFDEADITDLENFRKSESNVQQESDYKLTILSFVCAVVAKALQTYPQFNASLEASGDQLIYKKYCNIGIAVDTPNGLVVPVIQNVPNLTVIEIAKEMARLSNKAREKGLSVSDMSGGCFTISSLGGIGGTAFTPIVNSPEVAILGLSRSSIKPVFNGEEFKPRLMLPLSLSYDHRVIDGAEAARFTRFICDCLSDIRKVLL